MYTGSGGSVKWNRWKMQANYFVKPRMLNFQEVGHLKLNLKCRSCVDRSYISVPGLRKKEVGSFLQSLTKGGQDVFVGEDLRRAFCLQVQASVKETIVRKEKLEEPKVEVLVKEEIYYQEEDEGDFKDTIDGLSEEEQTDFVDDSNEKAGSDGDSFSENESSSEDSDYEEPSRRKKKRKNNLSNLKQFKGRSEAEIGGRDPSPTKRRKGHFACEICEKWFRLESILLNHVLKKHGPHGPPTCAICLLTFESEPAMRYHRKIAHSDKIACEECGKSFPESTIAQHMANTHDVCEPRTCEHCGAVFTNEMKFSRHVKSHIDPRGPKVRDGVWVAKIKENCRCQMEFPSKKSHIEHYKIVHENFQKCPKCEKLVPNVDDRRHRCEKYKPKNNKRMVASTCTECGQSFETYKSMWYHINAFHSKTPASCEVCGKIFKSRIHMQEHLKKAHAEKSTCVLCGAQVTFLFYPISYNLKHLSSS